MFSTNSDTDLCEGKCKHIWITLWIHLIWMGYCKKGFNSIANALELRLSCTNPSICWCLWCWNWNIAGKLHQPRLWFITGGYLVKRWFIPAAARARGQSNDLNREILASNLFNCHKEVINTPPVPSISRCIHIVYRHKNVWEYQWSNFIYNCMSTFLHYVHCKDALLDCSAPGGEGCESLT